VRVAARRLRLLVPVAGAPRCRRRGSTPAAARCRRGGRRAQHFVAVTGGGLPARALLVAGGRRTRAPRGAGAQSGAGGGGCVCVRVRDCAGTGEGRRAEGGIHRDGRDC
jgi:hypothetical protein